MGITHQLSLVTKLEEPDMSEPIVLKQKGRKLKARKSLTTSLTLPGVSQLWKLASPEPSVSVLCLLTLLLRSACLCIL